MITRILLSLFLVLAWVAPATAVRLGLHVSDGERLAWLARSQSGPYRVAGDVSANSPGDWTRIAANADAFVADPAPKESHWTGQTAASCKAGGSGAPMESNRTMGDTIRDSAFRYLVTGNVTYRSPVVTELLAQAAEPGTNWADGVRWCVNSTGDQNPFFDIATWVLKLMFAYDYVLAGDTIHGQTLSSGNRATIDGWFANAATFWAATVDKSGSLGQLYVTRSGLTDPGSFALSGTGTTQVNTAWGTRIYCGASRTNSMQQWYSNRRVKIYSIPVLWGIMQNDATLMDKGRRYYREALIYSLWPSGHFMEYDRLTASLPPLGWGYVADTLGTYGLWADAYARRGDTSLFDFSTSTGAGFDTTAGGPKTLKLAFDTHAQYVNWSVTHYAINQASGCTGTTDQRVGPVHNASSWFSIRDQVYALPNLFYRDADLTAAYRRTVAGAPAYPSNPASGGYYVWGEPSGILPGTLFMFGQMENAPGNPHSTADTLAPKAPTVPSATDISATRIDLAWTPPTQNTDNSALTDLAGYDILWCQNAACTPTTLIQIAAPASAYSHTGLTSSTLYRYLLYARDTSGNRSPATAIVEDTTQAGPPPSLELHWPLDEASGTTAGDDSGNALNGTVAGSAVWDTPGLIFDGVDDDIQVGRNVVIETTDVTVCFFLTRNGAQGGNYAPVLFKSWGNDAAPTYASYGIFLNYAGLGSDRITFHTGHAGGLDVLHAAAGAVPDATRTHYCFIYSPSGPAPQKRIYIGGNLAVSSTLTTALVYDTTAAGNLFVGSNPDNEHLFRGTLEDIRIYDGALQDSIIAELALGTPAAVGVFAMPEWCWTRVDSLETAPCTRPAGVQGRIVDGNKHRLRTRISRTVDTSALAGFALYGRSPAGSGTWFQVTDDCAVNAACYGTDKRYPAPVLTTPKLVAAGSFTQGGKLYVEGGARNDQHSIEAAKSVEREHVIRLNPALAPGDTIGFCERLADGTTLDSCSEATAIVTAPASYGP